MNSTSPSLLNQLRDPGERQAWNRFVDLYTPFLYRWAKRICFKEDEAAELVQDVFVILLTKLPEFSYQPGRSFRGWLRTVLLNRRRETYRQSMKQPKATGEVDLFDLQDPEEAEALWDTEYRQYVVQRALKLMQTDFEPTTWQTCWEVIAMGRSPAEVASEYGTTVGAVYAAKFRILARLRQEFEGLLD